MSLLLSPVSDRNSGVPLPTCFCMGPITRSFALEYNKLYYINEHTHTKDLHVLVYVSVKCCPSLSSGSIYCWVGCNEFPPVVHVLRFPCCLYTPYPDHSVMLPIHIILGLPLPRLPSMFPSNNECWSVLYLMIWPK